MSSIVVISLHELLGSLLIHHLLLTPGHSLCACAHLAHNETSRVLVRSLGLTHHVAWLASAHNVLLLWHTWLHHTLHAHDGLLATHPWLSHRLPHSGSHSVLAHHPLSYLLTHHRWLLLLSHRLRLEFLGHLLGAHLTTGSWLL